MNQRPKIKICCITNKSDLRIALDAGVDALGFVSKMPSGPGVISDLEIKELIRFVPKTITSFLLTSLTDPWQIISQIEYCGTNAAQLCNYVGIEDLHEIRSSLPDIKIMNVVHVNTYDDIALAKQYALNGDFLLLDSGKPKADIQILGGSGIPHNWNISAEIVERVKIPVWLAGGLNAENVKEAIGKVKPYGIDVCSGVRKNGALDAAMLKEFLEQIIKQ